MQTFTRTLTETVSAAQYKGEKDLPSDFTDIGRVGFDPHTRVNVLAIQSPAGGLTLSPSEWLVISPTEMRIMGDEEFARTYTPTTAPAHVAAAVVSEPEAPPAPHEV